jgi:hypothetical protein
VLKIENAEIKKALVCTHGGLKKILRMCIHGSLAWELCKSRALQVVFVNCNSAFGSGVKCCTKMGEGPCVSLPVLADV